jgi:two-component system, sensor histidine kinase and response regulator
VVEDDAEEYKRLLHFLYAAPVGLVQTSLDGEIELINSAAAKLILPVAPERKLSNLFTALTHAAPSLRRSTLLANKLSCTVCERLRYAIEADTRTVFVSLDLMKIDGKRLIAVLTDVTQLVHQERAVEVGEALHQYALERSHERLEHKVAERTAELERSQQELDLRARQAEAASRAKGEFLANMSHEIRTPLNAILGSVELLRRDTLLPRQLERISHLEVSAKYLLSTLNDVLDLSRIEAGDLQLEDTEFALDDVLSQVHTIVRDAAAAKHLRLELDAAKAPQQLRGDPKRLAQILVNFLSNAIKFTTQGGARLEVTLLDQDADSCQLSFEVHDTGVGLSAEESAQLFAAFERGGRSQMLRGAGLGLAINARLAALMHGKVGVRSELGQGSTFWLTLRLGKAAPPQPTPHPELSAEALLQRDHLGKRVLVVEDDPMNQAVALELLRNVGFDLVLASDGLEAVQLVENSEFAIVLMDLKMPRLDGLQATAAIRALPGRRKLPIVAMTANTFQEDRERCLAAGMDDILGKPIYMETLCEMLLRWLSQPGGAADDAAAGGRLAT